MLLLHQLGKPVCQQRFVSNVAMTFWAFTMQLAVVAFRVSPDLCEFRLLL